MQHDHEQIDHTARPAENVAIKADRDGTDTLCAGGVQNVVGRVVGGDPEDPLAGEVIQGELMPDNHVRHERSLRTVAQRDVIALRYQGSMMCRPEQRTRATRKEEVRRYDDG